MMAKKNTTGAAALTPSRLERLYKLLTLIAAQARSRDLLSKRLKIDVRGFYRDIEYLRSLDIEIGNENDRYYLVGNLDDALSQLPFPDPGLSLQEALLLARGRTEAHRRLRTRIDHLIRA